MYRVDKGSPSEESGLKVGDQIMDINGHSFASIFHQEAVYILRSYPTLIMTIKVKRNYRKFNVLISLDHSHTLSIVVRQTTKTRIRCSRRYFSYIHL